MKLQHAVTLAALSIGCTPPAPPDGERSAELVTAIESGSIAAAACPCTDITAATAADGHVEVFARSSADGALWRIWESGGSYPAVNAQRLTTPAYSFYFHRWFFIPAESIERAPTVTSSRADGMLHVFYSRGSDNELVEKQGSGTGLWSTAELSHSAAFHDPSVVELDDGTLALVAAGNDGQPRVSFRATPSAGWSAWSLAGTLPAGNAVSGKIAPVQTGDGALWLFARFGSGATWYASVPSPGGAFSPWTSLGGYMQFPVAAAVDANGTINVIGVGGDGQIWLDLQNERNSSFGGWIPLVPGSISGVATAANSAPVIGSNVDAVAGSFTKRLEIFFTNSSGSFWSVAQISPGTWNNLQTGITQSGGYWWSANGSAVATEADGRPVGFSLDSAGGLRFARAAKPVASLALGSLVGRYHGRAAVFKGVPYAQPPVGVPGQLSLRWRPPQEVVLPWGSRDAGTFAQRCAGKNANGPGVEDCLYLNVFAPSQASRIPLPVLVFIHGGGNTGGTSMFYDGASLVNRAIVRGTPVIVVTLQYRLGVFAFLAYPGQGTGNYGLRDQVKALEWVQKNIARFGGDPSHVLLFGESAGARNVEVVAASPLTHGKHLFSSALMGSGADVAWLPSLAQVQQGSQALAQSVGCPNDYNCLLGKSTSDLITAANNLLSGTGDLMTNIDGIVLNEDLRSSLAHNLEVPVVIGANPDEFTVLGDDPNVPVTAADYTAYINKWWGAGQALNRNKPFDATVAPKMLALYPPMPDSVHQQIANDTDSSILCPTREAARIAVQTGQPVYRYLFTHALEDPNASFDGVHPAATMGAFHGAELSFVFSSLGRLMPFGMPYRTTAAEQALSDTLIGYWTRFAATGNPNGGGAPAWPAYVAWSTTSDPALQLDDSVQLSPGYHIAECDYIAPWL